MCSYKHTHNSAVHTEKVIGWYEQKYKITYEDGEEVLIPVSESDLVSATENQQTDCHGTVFIGGANWISSRVNLTNGDVYRNVQQILNDDGWNRVGSTLNIAKQNDLAIFVDKDGITHSAIYNGDGTFQSKNGDEPYQENATLESLTEKYGKVHFFRGGGNKVLEGIDDKIINSSSEGSEVNVEDI